MRVCPPCPRVARWQPACDHLTVPKVAGIQGAAMAKAMDDVLTAALDAPAALVLEGEAGIGKTTLWSAGVEQASTRGFRVLAACPAEAESVLAYGAVADLLRDVEPSMIAPLPMPQRIAVNRILLQDDSDRAATESAVAAGLLSIVTALAAETPLLIALDDVQWLDPSSAHAIAFVARRLPPRVALLATVRTDSANARGPRIELQDPAATTRFLVEPMTLGALHAIIHSRLGISLSRPKMVQIHQMCAGNPFFALELARAVRDAPPGTTDARQLPSTVGDLVRARVESLGVDCKGVLLAVACSAGATVEEVAVGSDTDFDPAVRILEAAEGSGIVSFDGGRVRFTHPLLAHGVYNDAPRAQRRRCHQRLATVVHHPELRARHLALAAVRSDPSTLQALDEAAELAVLRGAPAAAAELVNLAIGLGGDTAKRRIQLATYYFQAGDVDLAKTEMSRTIAELDRGDLRAEASTVLAAALLYRGSHAEAEQYLTSAVDEPDADLTVRVRAMTMLALAQLNTGKVAAARVQIEAAVADAERLGESQLLSQALGIRALAQFSSGQGFDADDLQRAIRLEDPDAAMLVAFRPSMQHAFLLACTGELDEAKTRIAVLKRQCLDRGDESELMFAILYSALIAIFRGEFSDATRHAVDASEHASQLGGDVAEVTASTIRAMLATYAGRVDEARATTATALAAGARTGSSTLSAFAIANLGFLEVSVGNHEAAAATLAPMLAVLDMAPDCTELLPASFAPDAVEALVNVGRATDAEPVVTKLERNGIRLDRPWMLAVGARCRALLLAAERDVDGALVAAEQAMLHHERLPMPFERARTQLLLGQLQRRLRKKDAAATTLTEALHTFEHLDTPLWAQRARSELARVSGTHDPAAGLTPTERRVAELAASGMTNRDVAATMFISPKTVEVNLSRIYRKLGIRSRAELGRTMAQLDG